MPFPVKDRGLRKARGIAPLIALQDPVANPDRRRAINIRAGADEFLVETDTADIRVAFTPRIAEIWWHDVSANAWHNLRAHGDAPGAILDSRQTGIVQFTLDSDDFLYIGAVDVIAGARFTIDSTILNNNAATLTGEYSSGGSGFTASAITEDTTSGGAPFGKATGNFEFDTVPAAGTWIPIDLHKPRPDYPGQGMKLYWMRIVTDTLLDAVEIEQVAAFAETIVDDTGDADAIHLDDAREYTIPMDGSVGGIEFWSAGINSVTNLSWLLR